MSRSVINTCEWYSCTRRLNTLNANPSVPAPEIELQNFLNEHMQMVPVIGFTDMNSFMRFLSNNGLVEQKNGSYQITDKGQSFLAYISGRKYAIYKAG